MTEQQPLGVGELIVALIFIAGIAVIATIGTALYFIGAFTELGVAWVWWIVWERWR